MSTPRVSVCVPTYNYAHYLPDCVGSVLAQTFQDWELIVVDDCSKDETDTVMARFTDERIAYVKNETNLGLVRNVNRTVKLARGEFILVLHADDMLQPTMLEQSVGFLDRHPNAGYVHSAFLLVRADGSVIRRKGHQIPTGVYPGRDEIARLLMDNEIGLPTVLIRRSSYEALGLYDESYEWVHDWEMWARLALNYDVGYIAEPLALARTHTRNVTVVKFLPNPRLASDEELRLMRSIASRLPNDPETRRLVAHGVDRVVARYVGRCYALLRRREAARFRAALRWVVGFDPRVLVRFPLLLPLLVASCASPRATSWAMSLPSRLRRV